MRKMCVILVSLCTLLVGCKSAPIGPDYKAVEGKGEPLLVRWDFSHPLDYHYKYKQSTMQNAASFAGGQVDKVILKGESVIQSEGKGEAIFKIGKLKVDKKESSEAGAALIQEGGDMELKGLQEDGSFAGKELEGDVVIKTILKLPTDPIAEGATEVVDLEMPFNWNGQPGKLRGKQATTFKGFYEIYGVNCVHLDTQYEYYLFESDDGETTSTKMFNIKGDATIYFDNEAKRIHRSDVECEVKFDLGLASVDYITEITLHALSK